MPQFRAAGAASALAIISDYAFFESVILHELAHAALDDMPCSFPSCIVGQEYIAYAMQITRHEAENGRVSSTAAPR